jgi:hypothetical protein
MFLILAFLFSSCVVKWPIRTVAAIYSVDSNNKINKIKKLKKQQTIYLNKEKSNLQQESKCQIKYYYEFNFEDTYQFYDSIHLIKTCFALYNELFKNKKNYKSPNIFMKFEETKSYSYWGAGNFEVSVNRSAGFVYIKEKNILIYTDVRCPHSGF